MILSEYEAKRAELDRRLQEVGERESAHKMELSVKYQADCKRIQAQIWQLKKSKRSCFRRTRTTSSFSIASTATRSTKSARRCTHYDWSI